MLIIRLLGPPTIEESGRPLRSPRGHKALALLAYLLLSEKPPSRRRVAEMLFGDAEDPLRALRWSLAELRRAVGGSTVVGGDPLTLNLASEVVVDVVSLTEEPDPARPLPDDLGDLLEGVQLASCPQFEYWLLVERHRVSALIEARMRQAAVALVAIGRAAEAVPYAARAVARNPWEEGHHQLLVRSLAMAGDRPAALRHIAACEDLLRRELGIEASPALREAATVEVGSAMVPALSGRAAAASQLEAGRAAIVAGAVDAGVQCLRRAVAEAARCADARMHARALVALGGALVHAARGRDEEGALVLQEAIPLAMRAGDRASTVAAYRELGFVEVQAGRRRTAETWLAKAQALAETDTEVAAVQGIRGMNASDCGRYPDAFEHLAESIERARRGGDERQQAWSLSILGRAHLLRGERNQARVAVAGSLELVRQQRWLAFLPWPQALRAELDLMDGDVDAAALAALLHNPDRKASS